MFIFTVAFRQQCIFWFKSVTPIGFFHKYFSMESHPWMFMATEQVLCICEYTGSSVYDGAMLACKPLLLFFKRHVSSGRDYPGKHVNTRTINAQL